MRLSSCSKSYQWPKVLYKIYIYVYIFYIYTYMLYFPKMLLSIAGSYNQQGHFFFQVSWHLGLGAR